MVYIIVHMKFNKVLNFIGSSTSFPLNTQHFMKVLYRRHGHKLILFNLLDNEVIRILDTCISS